MSPSLITVSAFEWEQDVSYFVFSSLSIFLSTATNVTNLNPLKLDNNFFSLVLTAYLVSLSCSSEFKEFECPTL